MELEEVGIRMELDGGWVSGWSWRRWVCVRMEWEEVGVCQDRAGGGGWVSG